MPYTLANRGRNALGQFSSNPYAGIAGALTRVLTRNLLRYAARRWDDYNYSSRVHSSAPKKVHFSKPISAYKSDSVVPLGKIKFRLGGPFQSWKNVSPKKVAYKGKRSKKTFYKKKTLRKFKFRKAHYC